MSKFTKEMVDDYADKLLIGLEAGGPVGFRISGGVTWSWR